MAAKVPKRGKKVSMGVESAIKAEYLTGNFTDAELSERHKVAPSTIAAMIRTKKWKKQRDEINKNVSESIAKTVTLEIESAASYRAKEAFAARKRYIDMLFTIEKAAGKKVAEIVKRKPEKQSMQGLSEAVTDYRVIVDEITRLNGHHEWQTRGKALFAQCQSLEDVANFVSQYGGAYFNQPAEVINAKLRVISKKAETDSRNKIPVRALQEFINLTGKMLENYVPTDKRVEAAEVMNRNIVHVEKFII